MALTKGTKLEVTHQVMREDGKSLLSALAAGRLMIVSPTQFVPLTTIRDGVEKCLELAVMLQARGLVPRRPFLIAVVTLAFSFEFPVLRASITRRTIP